MISRAMEFGGKNYKFLVKGDRFELALYHGLEDKIPQDVKDKVAEVNWGLKDSGIKVPIILGVPSE